MGYPKVGVLELVSGLKAEIEPHSTMDLIQAKQWIDEVRPLVKSLVPSTEHTRVDELTIAVRNFRESPYGMYLGSWIEDRATGPIIYSQESWATPLALMFIYTPHWLFEQGPLICRTRMQIGVTNDVWQPFVTNPEAYSMVRHHGLMLTAAWCWLPEDYRRLWIDVLTEQLDVARHRLAKAGDVVGACDQAEKRATALWQLMPSGSTSEHVEIMGDYYLACCVGLASLVRWVAPMSPVDRERTLRRWQTDHVQSNFNVDLICEMWRSIEAERHWLIL